MAKRSYPTKLKTGSIGLTTQVVENFAKANKEVGTVPVMRVYGRIKSTEKVMNTFGESTRFKGEFEAINLLDQSEHRSQVLFVPHVAEQVINDIVSVAKKADPDCWVKFGVDITATYKPNTGNQTGTQFYFGVTPLIEPADGEDVLSQIAAELGIPKAAKQLTAPLSGKGKKK